MLGIEATQGEAYERFDRELEVGCRHLIRRRERDAVRPEMLAASTFPPMAATTVQVTAEKTAR
jgi:hypothetical protein